MGLKKILKKVSCKIFFCMGSKCSFNEHGKGKIRIDLNEENNILSNNNEQQSEESKVNKDNFYTSDI
jgi:hypothetical protein